MINSAATETKYQAIYLSPHLDDVVFSCGGQIFMQTSAGKPVLIVTIATGSPPRAAYSEFVQLLHERWGAAEATNPAAAVFARRRAEDVAACSLLGAEYAHWDILDCIYRLDPGKGEQLYHTRDDIFGMVHPADELLLEQLAQRIARLPAHDQLFVPLTAGNHVDHQLTRAAAERAFAADQLFYYEDYPYVRDPEALTAVLRADGNGDWKPQVITLNEAALEAKVAAVLAYESQLSSFFNDPPDVDAQINAYARQVLESGDWRSETRDWKIKRLEVAGSIYNNPPGAERVWRHGPPFAEAAGLRED
jgi:LmbE family N-acetylglucosaminyl deacetylase